MTTTDRTAAPRVLLVEDEPNIREAMRFILSRDGWDVAVHADGATAAGRIAADAPDIVVLDAMLPNVSGFDVLRAVRGAGAGAGADGSELPILMLTARGQERDRALAMSLGVTDYMTKPFSNAALLDRLRGMLHGRRPADGDRTRRPSAGGVA